MPRITPGKLARDDRGTAPIAADGSLLEAERWFLRRGLPSAIPLRARWRFVVSRSVPALAAWAVLMVLSMFVMAVSGDHDIEVDDDPTALQWFTLIVLFLIPVLTALAGWGVSRIRGMTARRLVAVSAIMVGVVSDWYGDDPLDVLTDTLRDLSVVAGILVATGVGAGAVLGWAVRETMTHLRSAGRLMARALPVVLLTVLVFFNATVWSVATNIGAGRMWLLIAFMTAIAVSFLVAGLVNTMATVTTAATDDEIDDERLSDTPFAVMTGGGSVIPLRSSERINVVLAAVISQVVQLFLLAGLTGALFFGLGLIVLNPAVLDKLTSGAPSQSVWLDITLPVSVAHIHVTAFLTALTFMYVSAKAVGDGEYRQEFLDPVLEGSRLALVARHRYRTLVG